MHLDQRINKTYNIFPLTLTLSSNELSVLVYTEYEAATIVDEGVDHVHHDIIRTQVLHQQSKPLPESRWISK